MPLCEINFFSNSLQKAAAMYVILPDPSIDPPYFTLYQLHGLSDDYTIWLRRTSIERYAAGLPLVVVMPDGGRGFYTDAAEGYAHESHIMKDTLGFIEKYFPVKKSRTHRAIGGLSMGGYGAMKLALKYPKVFGSVAAHSSAFLRGSDDFSESAEFRRIFGENPSGGANDVFALAERLAGKDIPAIRFDCGKSDFLLEANRKFHKHLARLGITHTYREYPGIHEWDYWDTHYPKALKFHRKALGF
jgi:putative tributyrin esterase